jgi:serine/threonine protein kinase
LAKLNTLELAHSFFCKQKQQGSVVKTESDLVEKLFDELVNTDLTERNRVVSNSPYPVAVKQAATDLIKAYESQSTLLNKDLVSDVAEVSPSFFEAEPSEKDEALKPGDRIGNYVIDSKIGEGGMSIIYKATQQSPIKRMVALKFVRPSLLAPRVALRFLREQQALALVGHPNIATLFEVGSTPNGQPFAVMEYVQGLPITQFCEKHQLDSKQRTILMMQACAGLAHAHRHGIIHRDVKPDNILVCIRDRKPIAKLIDFGIARINRDDLANNQTLTQMGQILGSPRYMSPEQFSCKQANQRSDIYSAALVLYELISRAPYREGVTTEEIVEQAQQAETVMLSASVKSRFQDDQTVFGKDQPGPLVKFLKKDFDWIMATALALDPSDRYSSVLSFVKDLRAALRNEPVSVSRPSASARLVKYAGSNRKTIGIAAAIGSLLLLGFGWWTLKDSESKLSQARQEVLVATTASSASTKESAAANDLIMRLLASDMYELTTDQFDLNLIPVYESQFEKIKLSGGPKSNEDRTVYGILAVLYAMSGDFDQSDNLMKLVTEDKQQDELRIVREKICREYAETAKQRLTQLVGEQHSTQRALQQVTLARCYVVWGMWPDAESLASAAITHFDDQDPESYQALVSRNTLAEIYQKTNQSEKLLDLIQDTHQRFCNCQPVLSTAKGAAAFENVSQMVQQLKSQGAGEGDSQEGRERQ